MNTPFYKIVGFLFFAFWFTSFQMNEDKIYWSEDRPLTFNDFKGEPTMRQVAALSYCGIKFNSCYSAKYPTYEVFAYFEPKNSWAWKNYRYPYVIKHEQLHFDIAEIYARKLRKYFAENKVPIWQAKRVYQSIYHDYEGFQELYDERTKHGTDNAKQKEWAESITNELHALDDFSAYKCY